MDLYKVVDQAAKLLKQRGGLTYRLLKRQFDLDDEVLDDLKEELLLTYSGIDEDGRGLVWTGDLSAPEPASISTPTASILTLLTCRPTFQPP